MNHIYYVLAVIVSHVEAWNNRVWLVQDGHRPYRGVQRRTNPRECVLCGGPMQKDFRAGQDTLKWFRCGRCHQSQQGVM